MDHPAEGCTSRPSHTLLHAPPHATVTQRQFIKSRSVERAGHAGTHPPKSPPSPPPPRSMPALVASAAILSMTLTGPVTPPPRTSCPVVTPRFARGTPTLIQMKMDGGDLERGLSQERNADIHRLKKLFYSQSAEGSEDEACEDGIASAAAEGWLLRDLPLARWHMALLPHQQVLLNVFQPEYVHMFEALLATPQPWYYMHALLAGGVEHLGHPDHALPGLGGAAGCGEEPGEKAHLQGVLMEVVSVERRRDSRLRLVVHGVGRAVVLRGTQALPYARADVAVLPDAEQLSAAAVRVERCWTDPMRERNEELLARLPGAVLAAAAAEDGCWRAYEFAPFELGRISPPSYASLCPAAVVGCARRARELRPPQGGWDAVAGEEGATLLFFGPGPRKGSIKSVCAGVRCVLLHRHRDLRLLR